MPTLDEIINQSEANVKSLSEKLKDLDKLREEIKELIKQPEMFNSKYQEIVKLAENYTNTLGAATKTYLDGSNTLFMTNLNELSTKIKEFEKENTRLVNTDFTKLFKDLQQVFIDQTRKDLSVELKRFEEKSKDLQAKIDDLKKQIERLERIDLEKHFGILQKTLSEIFGAVNAINLTLISITQALTDIVQSLRTIQTAIDTNHKETKQLINSFIEATLKNLAGQDTEAKKNSELLESKIKSLAEQNDLLKNEVKTNRIIQIIGLTIILIVLIYIAVKL